MTKYYSLNGGQYLTYDQLHNEQGWTDHPTTQIEIKSIEPWGGIEDDGLMDIGSEVIVDAMHASYFLNGTTGWWTINTLLTNLGCYPDIGTDDNIVNNGTIQCNAAIIYGELQHPYYLVEKATELGWMDEDTFADSGWVLGELPEQNKSFYVLDAVTGEELNSTKGIVDHLICDRYNILEDGGVKHFTLVTGYARGMVPRHMDSDPETSNDSQILLFKDDQATSGSTLKYSSSKNYGVLHVYSAENVLADEWLPYVYLGVYNPTQPQYKWFLSLKTTLETYDIQVYQVDFVEY